jgi:hypothetical protein
LDCRPKKFKTGEIQTKTAKSKQKSGKSKYKICEIQTIKNTFFFGFRQSFVWISRIFEFSKESGKSKLKNSEIQTIMRGNPNKKAFFFILWISSILCLGFPDLSLDFALFIFGYR